MVPLSYRGDRPYHYHIISHQASYRLARQETKFCCLKLFITFSAAEHGRNPVSKHQIQPENGDEQADAGRDG